MLHNIVNIYKFNYISLIFLQANYGGIKGKLPGKPNDVESEDEMGEDEREANGDDEVRNTSAELEVGEMS